jgi:hypothetical protein
MDTTFDELTDRLPQSVTRRGAFRKFGAGLAGIALAAFGLADKARAAGTQRVLGYCQVLRPGLFHHGGSLFYTGKCMAISGCALSASADCPAYGTLQGDTSHNKLGCNGAVSVFDTSMVCTPAP